MAHKSGKLIGKIAPITSLGEFERQELWMLYHRYYADVTQEIFFGDLKNKNDIVLLRDNQDQSLQGFSTFQTYERTILGKKIFVLYSGDTVVAPAYWGQLSLQRHWARYAIRCKLKHPFMQVYWLLLTKGYKTYLLLSRYFATYWPRHDKPTPPWETAVIDELCREKFGEDWVSDLGVIRHKQRLGRLKEEVAPIEEPQLRYPDIRFFAERNPGHAEGDELGCIGKVEPAIFRTLLVKMFRKRFRRKKRLGKAS